MTKAGTEGLTETLGGLAGVRRRALQGKKAARINVR